MSSGIDLRVSRSLEVLATLRRTAVEFAKREEQLTREMSTRRNAANRKHREAMAKTEARLAAQLEDATAAFASEEEHTRALHEARRVRIQRYQTAGMRNLPKRAQEEKGRWLGRLQLRQLKAERGKTSGLNAADAALAKFAAKLAEQRTIFADLESRARSAFRGYGAFQRMLRRARSAAAEAHPSAEGQEHSYEQLEAALALAGEQLAAFQQFMLPRVFRFAPLPVLIPLIGMLGVAVAYALGFTPAAWAAACGVVVVLVLVVCGVHFFGMGQSRQAALAVTAALADAGRIHDVCRADSKARHFQDRQTIDDEYDRTAAAIDEQWNRAGNIEAEFEQAARERITTHVPRAFAKNAELLIPKLRRIESGRTASLGGMQSEGATLQGQLDAGHAAEMAALSADEAERWAAIEADWRREIVPIYQDIAAMNDATAERFPAWNAQVVEAWTPPRTFTPATKFAHLALDLAPDAPKDPRLALPAPQVSIPLALTFPEQGSLLFETNESGGAAVIGTLNNVILRLLATTPPGKLSFTIIDPVGLGESFAGLMHLADYEERASSTDASGRSAIRSRSGSPR